MKKFLLLIVLLPYLGFSQTTVATWNTQTPTAVANINASSLLVAGGVSMNMTDQYNANGFEITNLHNNGAPTTSPLNDRYLEFKINPNSNYKVTASHFNFTCFPLSDGGAKKVQIKASVTGGSFVNLTNASGQSEIALTLGSDQLVSVNFPSNFTALPNQTITVRLYFYDLQNSYYSKVFIRTNAYGSSISGPSLTGTVATYSPTLLAVNDSFSTNINTFTNLTVLGNDSAGATPINNVSIAQNPANGTVSVNADRTIKYTPATDFIGTDSFKYTITNSTSTSTATVSISVAGIAPTGTLNGKYFVGTGGHFTTITSAVAHLNQYGVNGPVTFLLKNNNYNNNTGETFPLTLTQFAGTSGSNTVTFKPATDKNVVILANEINNYTGVPAVFKLDGADNIIFDGSNTTGGTTRNLTINNGCTINYVQRAVIWVASNGSNGAVNVTVKNTNVRQTAKNQNSMFCMGVYSGANTTGDNNTLAVNTATANNSNLTVVNNDFMNVKEGVYVNGGNTAITNVVISQNDLGSENNSETIILPASLNNVNTFEYSENLIYNLYRDNTGGALMSAGIHITGASQNGVIARNRMSNLIKTSTESYTFGGIVLGSTLEASNIRVENNFILNVAGNNNGGSFLNGHGIVVESGGGYKIYHNTVSLNTNQSGSGAGYSSALYVNPGVKGLDVRNNIFQNNQTSGNVMRCAVMVKNHSNNINAIFSNLDYNNLYSNDKIGFIATGAGEPGNIDNYNDPQYIATLYVWKSITGKENNSISALPLFSSATDLHLGSNNDAINNKGTFLSAVTKDIDGQLRNTTTPDMGADEFGGVSMPAAGSNAGVYCNSSTTYDGLSWSNGEPTSEKDVIFTANYVHTGGTFNACSIFIQNTAVVQFKGNANAVVVHNVNVAPTASLTFESSSNLIQVTNTINTGNVTVKRNASQLKRLDYTMWSSPVTGSQTLTDFSPLTSANRFYTYNTAGNFYSDIASPGTTTFAKSKGYLIRMPNSLPNVPGYNAGTATHVYEGVFNGVPNNGTVTFPMEYTDASKSYNAVGNPYPSPISVTNFIDANIDNIEGTLYIWRKTNDPTKSSYSTVTKMAYVANAAPGGTNTLVADPFAIDGSGKAVLNTGQGFIVQAKAAKDIVFRNNMRKPVNYANFFRTGQDDDSAAPAVAALSRYWLNVVGTQDVFAQTVVGYTPEGSNEYDNGLDGKSFLDAEVNVYTVAGDLNLSIQARPEFTMHDTVTLGFKTAVAGDYQFTIDRVDGLFDGEQAIYIKDKTTGAAHNLKEGNYAFQSEAGTFNDRFEVIYTTEPLLTTDSTVVNTKDVIIYRNGKQINVTSPQMIGSVIVYDMLGRIVHEQSNIDSNEFSTTSIESAQQVLIVKVIHSNRQVVSKKIMMN